MKGITVLNWAVDENGDAIRCRGCDCPFLTMGRPSTAEERAIARKQGLDVDDDAFVLEPTPFEKRWCATCAEKNEGASSQA